MDASVFWHHHDVATIAERILDAIRFRALDDDQIAKRLGVSQRQSINQTARKLEAQGLLHRSTGPDGKSVNALPEASAPGPLVSSTRATTVPSSPLQGSSVESSP